MTEKFIRSIKVAFIISLNCRDYVSNEMFSSEYPNIFIQCQSSPKPLWLCEISSLFMVHLGELVQSGKENQFTWVNQSVLI